MSSATNVRDASLAIDHRRLDIHTLAERGTIMSSCGQLVEAGAEFEGEFAGAAVTKDRIFLQGTIQDVLDEGREIRSDCPYADMGGMGDGKQ